MRRLPMVVVLLAACSGSSASGTTDVADVADDADVPADLPADTGPSYPLDDVLRVNHLQVKGTHNSYHVAPDPALDASWTHTMPPLDVQLERDGVRQLELDVHLTDQGEWLVHHIPAFDEGSTCPTFAGCLSIVKSWSDAHPGHHLLFLLIEPKDDLDPVSIAGHYDELDAAILAVWPRDRILAPDDVRGARADLHEAIAQDGWPTLGATRNKVMFELLDTTAHRDGYFAGRPNGEGRVMFPRAGESEAWGVTVELPRPADQADAIRAAALAGSLVRTSSDGVGPTDAENRARADAALKSGAHLISGDYPAEDTPGAYHFVLEGGTPSRCNPVTAPPECTPEAIENLPKGP